MILCERKLALAPLCYVTHSVFFKGLVVSLIYCISYKNENKQNKILFGKIVGLRRISSAGEWEEEEEEESWTVCQRSSSTGISFKY